MGLRRDWIVMVTRGIVSTAVMLTACGATAAGAQVAAFIERKIGLKYHWNKGVKTAVTGYVKAYSTWAYTKQAMDHWAQAIRNYLDKAHGVAPAK